MPGNGQHSNASVFDLDVPEAVKPLLIGIGQEAERVPEAERGLRAYLRFKRHLHRGRGPGRLGHGSAVEGAIYDLHARAAGGWTNRGGGETEGGGGVIYIFIVHQIVPIKCTTNISPTCTVLVPRRNIKTPAYYHVGAYNASTHFS